MQPLVDGWEVCPDIPRSAEWGPESKLSPQGGAAVAEIPELLLSQHKGSRGLKRHFHAVNLLSVDVITGCQHLKT